MNEVEGGQIMVIAGVEARPSVFSCRSHAWWNPTERGSCVAAGCRIQSKGTYLKTEKTKILSVFSHALV